MRVNRGNNGATNLNANNSWNSNSNNGFRPVLIQIFMTVAITIASAWLDLFKRVLFFQRCCKHINNGIMLTTNMEKPVCRIFFLT